MKDEDQSSVLTSPRFEDALSELFPGALRIEDYFEKTTAALIPEGFIDDNTLGIVATCRDEIASPLETEIIRHWGRTSAAEASAAFCCLAEPELKQASVMRLWWTIGDAL